MTQESPKPQSIANMIGYYGVLYLGVLLLLVVLYPLAQNYIVPNLSRLVPVNPNTSLMKTAVITSICYWGYVGWLMANRPKTSGNTDSNGPS